MATVATLRFLEGFESEEVVIGETVGTVSVYVEQTDDGTIHIIVKDAS